MRQVCDKLCLCISQTEQGARAILKREGVTTPAGEKLKEAREKATEVYFAILFLCIADCHRYGKIIK